MSNQHTWVVVLAAGEGRRLHGLTTTASGVVIPKQYCSLRGGPSLLQEALLRARAVAPLERICTVVADAHRPWWAQQARSLPRTNVITQPRNRGTGNGILLPLLQILRRDPQARIVLLPSDHYFQEEGELAHWLRVACARACADGPEILLLGFAPRSADSELGYIIPTRASGSGCWAVGAFVEKPPPRRASELVQQGALWNAFIIVADAGALLRLYERHYGAILRDMHAAVDAAANRDKAALPALYAQLPDIDFSRNLLEVAAPSLRVLAVPHCGWSDLGTPERVAAVLRAGARAHGWQGSEPGETSFSLAAQDIRRRSASGPGLQGDGPVAPHAPAAQVRPLIPNAPAAASDLRSTSH
jgi:mannose-1-phosphate guanylyltransferase